MWWSIFILITLVFLFISKINLSFSSALNYFIFQEVTGFLFLVFIGRILQIFLLIIKVGVSPLHFWVYNIISSLDNYLLLWFLTFQKLPFIPSLFYFLNFIFIFLLILGLLYCYFQIFIIKNFKLIFFVSSTESFNWIILGCYFGFWSFFLIFFYYILNIIFLVSYTSLNSLFIFSLETILVFLNLPLTVSFYLKIFILFISVTLYDFYFLLILGFIFISSLSFIYWIFNYRVYSNYKFKDFYTNIYFLFYFYLLFFIYYRFSKNYYITLIGWSSFEMIKH